MPRKKKTETKKAASKNTATKKPEVSAEEAKAALQREIDERITGCTQEIQAVLQRYRCDLHVSLTIAPPNKIMPHIQVVAIQQQ